LRKRSHGKPLAIRQELAADRRPVGAGAFGAPGLRRVAKAQEALDKVRAILDMAKGDEDAEQRVAALLVEHREGAASADPGHGRGPAPARRR
jgi:hypothetical protein